MGLGDFLSAGLSGIKSIGSVIAREATEFAGSFMGGITGSISGDPVALPKFKGISTVPEIAGGLLGQAAGGLVGGLVQPTTTPLPTGISAPVDPALFGRATKQVRTTVARAQPNLQALQVGTSGAEVMPTGGVMAQATALPGGAQIQTAGLFGDLTLPLIPQIGQALFGGETQMALPAAPGATPGTIFRVQNARLVPRRMFQIINPTTGSLVTYKNVGRPVLYSGDFAACKRVRKVAAKARRRSGGR